MRKRAVALEDLKAVFPVPPLARRSDSRRSLDLEKSERIVRHIAAGGLDRFMYGGNAFLYHMTLGEYEELVDWLSGFSDELWPIPSIGPSFGRALDQAPLVRRRRFPCAMLLPCADPRDAAGLEAGAREIADALGSPLILYVKDEGNFGASVEAGIDALGRLVDEGVCVAIKYAIVRRDPADDRYLRMLVEKVDRRRIVSGIGERPAIAHLRDWKLPGFTTGSGCVAPGLSRQLFEACARGDFAEAERVREAFLPLEDLRDAHGPARVLHAATELSGIAATGPIPPFVSALGEAEHREIAPAARKLLERSAVPAGTYVPRSV
jgi:dihydrodipicolinate synthase/N-acetylneuraminate lyase